MTGAAVRAVGLRKTYGKKEAVRGVDLEVERGTLYGFLGPNGAGKTTTIRMLTGLIRPSAGEARVAGLDVTKDPVAVKRKIALVPDEPTLFEKLSAREFLRFVGDVYGVEPGKARRRSEELLEMFELSGAADEMLGGYSHGMKQKAALAAALLHEPEILFLDEPTVGLDPASARLTKDLLRRLVERGGTVFLTTHILELAQVLCDEIGIIQHGSMLAAGTFAGLRERAHAAEDEDLEAVFLDLTGSGEGRQLAEYLRD